MAKTNARFATVKGQSDALSTDPFYRGIPQCERVMSVNETLAYLNEKLGYETAKIRSTLTALGKVQLAYLNKGAFSVFDGVSAVKIACRGGFKNVDGPWEKGRNSLVAISVERDPYKSTFEGVTPENITEGLTPVINTVMDETTGEFDVLTGTDPFSVAGYNLAPDPDAEDEYVGLIDQDGTLTKAAITHSDIGNVKAALTSAPAAGRYTLVVATRCGLGSEFAVVEARRKITVK